jgi:two-component system phosphate regulon sensor histidine kinase PhoR
MHQEPVTIGISRLSAIRLASAISDPLVIFSGKYEIVYQNDAAKAAFGELPPGRDLRTVFRMPSMIRLINEVVAQGRSMTADLSERVPVERSFRVIADPVGEGTGLFILLFKDQSEARRIDRMRSDFIANASHELRTPLASVAGFIETLRGPAKDDPKARAQFLEIMQEQTSRMSRLIDDLLSLSRVEMKPNLVPGQTVDLRSVLDGVVESLSHLARGLNVEIERDYEAGDFVVEGDKDELFQVFQNLIENACKYGHQGRRIVIFLRKRLVKNKDVIAAGVQDFGPGIPQEHLPRITERFYRVDVDNSRAKKGTGLGLSIVKHIVTRHNAELTIESAPGEGSVFTVLLPAARKEIRTNS